MTLKYLKSKLSELLDTTIETDSQVIQALEYIACIQTADRCMKDIRSHVTDESSPIRMNTCMAFQEPAFRVYERDDDGFEIYINDVTETVGFRTGYNQEDKCWIEEKETGR